MGEPSGPEVLHPEYMPSAAVEQLMGTTQQVIDMARERHSASRIKQYRLYAEGHKTRLRVNNDSGLYAEMAMEIVGRGAEGGPGGGIFIAEFTSITPRSQDDLYDQHNVYLQVSGVHQTADYDTRVVRWSYGQFISDSSVRSSWGGPLSPRETGEGLQSFLDDFLEVAKRQPHRRTGLLGRLGLRHAS